jgi:ornithine decarboxylase
MELAEGLPTPFFLFDLDRVRAQYEKLYEALGRAGIHYAVKANNHAAVLASLAATGCGFEVASIFEANLLSDLGVDPSRLIFSAPIKLASHIRDAFRLGIKRYVFDCRSELEKIAALAPGSELLIRLAVGNEGSRFPLSMKFGAELNESVALAQEASRAGLRIAGVAFHVGSQCEREETWVEAMEKASRLWRLLEERGAEPYCLDIGGGFPIGYDRPVPSLESIGSKLLEAAESLFPEGIELIAEPGRCVTGEAGVLVTSVIGRAKRDGTEWLYVDASALHGLMESLQAGGSFPYPLRTLVDTAERMTCVLAGPTCDPDDTIMRDAELPLLEVGDLVCILNSGAYSFVYSTSFHGYPAPAVHFIDRGGEVLWLAGTAGMALTA